MASYPYPFVAPTGVSQSNDDAVLLLTVQRFLFSSSASSQASCWAAQNPRQVVTVAGVALKSMSAAQGESAVHTLPFFTAGQATGSHPA